VAATGSLIIDVAEAVRTALDAASFSQAFTPERLWYVNWHLSDLSALRVAVVPASLNLQDLNRGRTGRKVAVDIGIHKKPESLNTTDVDPWVILTEEILEFFMPTTGAGKAIETEAPSANRLRCLSAELIDGAKAAISLDLLKEWRAYTGVIRTTWQVL
jgi:hypothetical protein